MGQTMNTKVISAHVPEELADKVDQIAARLDRSRGWVIKQVLADWLGQEEKRRRMTLETLAELTPDTSSTIKPCKPGPIASIPTSRYRFRADALEVDQQSARRSSAVL